MTLDGDRTEILRLRARVVVLERAVQAMLELALRIRPEELRLHLESAGTALDRSYRDDAFAADVADGAERDFLAGEVARLMRSLQTDLGFTGGAPQEPNG